MIEFKVVSDINAEFFESAVEDLLNEGFVFLSGPVAAPLSTSVNSRVCHVAYMSRES